MNKYVLTFALPVALLTVGCASSSSSHAPARTSATPVASRISTAPPASSYAPIPGVSMPPSSASAPGPHAACSPVTVNGNCYAPGESCLRADLGMNGTTARGQHISCRLVNGVMRWELAAASPAATATA